MYSGLLGITGRLDESLAQIKLAQEQDPLSYSNKILIWVSCTITGANMTKPLINCTPH